MAANDDMHELNTQKCAQITAGVEQPTGTNREISMAGSEHLQVTDQLAVKDLSANLQPMSEGAHQELVTPPAPNSGFEDLDNANFAAQLGNEQTATGNVPLSSEQPDIKLGADTVQTVQDVRDDNVASDLDTDEVDEPVRNHRHRHIVIDKDDEQQSDDDYSDDESRDSEDEEEVDEDEEEDMAEFQSKLKRSIAQRAPNPNTNWAMRHQLLEDDGDVQEVPRQEFDRNFTSQPHVKQEPRFNCYGGSHQAQQPLLHQYDPRLAHPFSGGMYGGHQISSFTSASQLGMHQGRSMDNGYHNSTRMPAGPNASHSYAQAFPLNMPQGQQVMGYSDPRYQPYEQGPLQHGYTHLPMSPYQMPVQGFGPPPPEHYQPPAQAMSTDRNMLRHGSAKTQIHETSDASDSTDDDEPLRTRVPRHPSKVSDAVEDSSTPAPKASKRGKQQKKDDDSKSEEVSSRVKTKSKFSFKDTKGKKTAPEKPATAKITPAKTAPAEPTQSAQPQPNEQVPASEATIDWKLPRYEAKFEKPKTKDEPTVAKISLPNLVREELLLSPDHAEQETHLLLHVFIPAHQALAQPDPGPANAVLNFHTIALMVIEAFVQFEIGDEFGTGRGHWHNAHDQSDVEYLRQRSAKDADPDEIFFAVIDRWRAGVESNKETAKTIRGIQEFCDVALDVIYYIKEHGLLKERQNAWEEKGTKKGAKKVGEDDEDEEGGGGAGASKGKKRTAVNRVDDKVRKKSKTKSEPKITVKKKPKSSGGGVSVIRKR